MLFADLAAVEIDLNLKSKIIIWKFTLNSSIFRYYVAFSDFHRATNDTILTRSKHVARLSNTPPHSQQQYSSSTRACETLSLLLFEITKKLIRKRLFCDQVLNFPLHFFFFFVLCFALRMYNTWNVRKS